MFRPHTNTHKHSVIGSFFDWPESPFRWKILDRADPFRAYKELDPFIEEPPTSESPVINPLQPIKPSPASKEIVNVDHLIIKVNPAKFPARYIEPKRNFIPSGRRTLARTPSAGKRSRSEDVLTVKHSYAENENKNVPQGKADYMQIMI